MPKISSPHSGSLQFWPRKRAEKLIPSINFVPLSKSGSKGILGFISYKVGMATAMVKDDTSNSMTKGKKIPIPVTILEAPNMKMYAVRFHKSGKVIKDIIVSQDKELKKVVKAPKKISEFEASIPKEYDDISIIVYSLPKQTAVKKTPDLAELPVIAENKIEFVKSFLNKEISIKEIIDTDLVDARGLTKGKGLVGPVQRFGITLKQHKSEKGVRRPGSLAPWHPKRVTFRTPMAGQLGMFSRVHYNHKVILVSSISENNINPNQGFRHYGKIKTNYIIVKGSVQGPSKRQILLTPSFRPTKLSKKTKYEFQNLA